MGELISLYLSLYGEPGHFTDPLKSAEIKYKIIEIIMQSSYHQMNAVAKLILCNFIQAFRMDTKLLIYFM